MKTRLVGDVSGLRSGASGGIRTILSGSIIVLLALFASGGISQIPYRGKTLSPPVHVTRPEHGNYGPVLTPKGTNGSHQKAVANGAKSNAGPAVNTSTWQSLGPAALNAPPNLVGVFGGSYASGRIAGVAVSPNSFLNIFIAAAGGGVWNTQDGGSTWTPLTDNQATLSMGSIAIAPNNPNFIYAGTGEANNSADSNHGMGILFSHDGGSTWTLSQGPGGVFNGLSVGKIAVDPTNALTAYAVMDDEGWNGGCYAIPSNCNGTGVYKTTDGGQTWLRVTPSGGYWGENTWSDVVVDPDTPTTIYAAQGNYVEASDNGVYTSPDGGATWLEFAGIPNGRSAWVGRIALAAGTGHVLYIAMVYSQDDPNVQTNPSSYYYGQPLAGTLQYMGRLDNANFTSPQAPTVTDLTPNTPNFCGSGAQGWYDLVLGVDPSNSSHIFAAGAYDYNFQNDAILESTTGGASWNDITIEFNVEPHTDYHAMAFDSGNNLLVGNDGGIWRYSSGTWTNLNGDLNTIQFYGISLHPTNPQIVLGGGQDNGSELYTGNPVWNAVTGGDGGYANISQTNPNVMYTTYTQGVTFGSVDGGNTFPQIFPYQGLSINTSLFNFITPTVADPANGDRLLIGGDYIWETIDDGADWTPHTNPSGLPPDSVAVLPGGNTIYIATGGTFNLRGFVYRSADDGNTWTQAAYTTSNSYHMHEIDIDPNDPTGMTAVVVIDRADPTSGHVFRTTNGGSSWTDITGNLPAIPTWSAKIDIDANQTIYVSNDTGVYSAPSPYSNWTPVGAGLPNAQGFNLQLNENPHELGLATHGRGAWLIGSLSISKSLAPAVIETGQPAVVTLTLTNTTGALQNQGAFTDTLVNMQAVGGAVTGTCAATPATLAAGATALSFSGISLPDQGTCTVIFSVTSNTPGIQTNTTSGLTGLALVTTLPSLPSNTVSLEVLAPPTIAKTFLPTTISPGNNSVVTLTLSNTNPLNLTSGAFTDTLVHMSAVGGAVGGTCVGTTPNTLTAGATALSFHGITIPASSSCTVTFSVTSSTPGIQPNTTSGVTTTQTPVAGAVSNAATLTVGNLPTIGKAFNPNAILPGANSVVTLTLSNSNNAALTGGSFTDTLVNMSAFGGAVGGTCVGTSPATLSGGTNSLSFSGITIPANGSCTVTFTVTSTTIGTQTNTTSGVTTTQSSTAGAASNTAKLYVLAVPTIAKAFNPQSIISGLTSLVTLTLTNSNAVDLNGGAFTDTLANMSAAGGAVAGTCVGTTPNTLAVGATALSFSGITIPANGTCTVTFSVTSSTVGAQPNTTSGVTTTQTPAAGPASNTPSLIVYAVPTISKAFNPASIASGGNSVVTLTLSNTNPNALVGANFSDTLVNMSAVGGAVTGTCVGTTPNTLAAGATALGFTAITIPKTSSCTVIFSVTSSTLGVQKNTATGVTTSQTTTAGPPSNTATLTVSSAPTISKAFSPATIPLGGNCAVTLTLTNGNSSALTGGAFTDTLVKMSAAGGAVTGTCAGTTPNTLAAGSTALSFTGITIPASGNCTVTFSVTSNIAGAQPNKTSGVTTAQTPTAGAASNTATLTVNPAATTTNVASSHNPWVLGESVTFTATVTSAAGTPSGSVTFLSNGTSIGTGTLSSGVANFSTTALPVGANSITASYGGSVDFSTSTSRALSEVIDATGTPAALSAPTSGAKLTGASATFTWTAGLGVTQYRLRLGTTGVGSQDVYDSGITTTTTETVTTLPTNGGTLYARIYSLISGVWQYKDYTYIESGTPVPAVLTSPTPGSTLTGSSVTFDWTAGAGVTYYEFRLGTTAPGAKDVYNSADVTTTALTSGVINNIPANGGTLFARLYSYIDGAWQYRDYTYIESGTAVPAVLTSPTPGSTLTGTSATFTWSAGQGVTYYQFRMGTTGPGSKDVYNAAAVNTTALTSGVISNIPTTGQTLYARIYSWIDGAWQYHDYTYMESNAGARGVLTSPTPGSTLTGSTATFTWTAGTNVTKYQFRVGTTGAGSSNIYNPSNLSTTALTTGLVSNIPTTGQTLYARLYSYIDGAWQYNDYTYTEAAPTP